MTHNQINYFTAKENKRSHLANEALAAESNAIGWRNAEIAQQNADTNAMNAGTNLLSVQESIRHNKAMEENQSYSNVTQRTGTLANVGTAVAKTLGVGTTGLALAGAAATSGKTKSTGTKSLLSTVSSLGTSVSRGLSTIAGTIVPTSTLRKVTTSSTPIMKSSSSGKFGYRY